MNLWINATASSNTKIIGINRPRAALADLWMNRCPNERLTTIRTVRAIGRTRSETNSRKYSTGIKG